MCIKADENERYRMEELLARPVHAVIAACLKIEADRIRPDSVLAADLGMSPPAKRRLQREIAFIFDCAEPELPETMKVEELVKEVATIEFYRLEADLSDQTTWYINTFRVHTPCRAAKVPCQ